ncbi:phosphonate ABC transporter substrate-binding protein [Oceanidesulfovibrio marinus]|nr:phosphonate ABC transporter substrate-binding protein [Oceanidesulfovibrio marinus]TVM33441.1 phosphonate ABC transporter substrate-binding protein [Oceanidesulfovibrio marinus]
MKWFGRIVAVALLGVMCMSQVARAEQWQKQYPEITLGVITSENEKDRLIRYELVQKYLEETLGVKIKWRTATDYAGVIEGVKAGKIQVARFGPASYAKCYIVTNGKVEPLVGALDKDGNLGYHSVIIVKTDSPYKTVQDLKGTKFAFADPNSTSGHQAPRYFLDEEGIKVDEFFSSATFSGSHENSVMGLVSGTYDAVATWWRSDSSNNPKRMESKGMIEPGQWRIIWKSPLLPSSPWAVPTDLPEDMRKDIQKALLELPTKDPEAWASFIKGEKISGFAEVTHEDYEPIVRMIQANLKNRKS